MDRQKKQRQRLVGLFLAGLALFNFPLLATVGDGLSFGSVPALYLYLFAVWGVLIVLTGLIADRRE